MQSQRILSAERPGGGAAFRIVFKTSQGRHHEAPRDEFQQDFSADDLTLPSSIRSTMLPDRSSL